MVIRVLVSNLQLQALGAPAVMLVQGQVVEVFLDAWFVDPTGSEIGYTFAVSTAALTVKL